MSLKLHFLYSPLDFFQENLGTARYFTRLFRKQESSIRVAAGTTQWWAITSGLWWGKTHMIIKE